MVEYAVVLGAEDVRSMHEGTVARLQREGITRKDFLNEFATMTLGCGAAAAVIGRADRHRRGTGSSAGSRGRARPTTSCASGT